jgi:hypothetical protein
VSADSFEPDRVLKALLDHDVRFVVIGGLAGNIRGTPIVTHDIDVCYSRDRGNLERLASALAALHAKLRAAGEGAELVFPLDARALVLGDTFTLRTDFGPLDILATPSGTRGFDDLDAAATSELIGEDLLVRVASVEDLIRMKRASGRTKDRLHLPELEALRDEIAEHGDPFA